jgi:hypothetical protein
MQLALMAFQMPSALQPRNEVDRQAQFWLLAQGLISSFNGCDVRSGIRVKPMYPFRNVNPLLITSPIS